MAACMTALDGLSALPAAVWQQHAPPAWTVAAACAGALWLLAPRGFPARPVGLVAMLPLFLVFPPPPALGTARVTVLDVGHGLAVVVQTHGHALLYDTGPAYGPGADAGNRVVVPFLRAAGVSRLDGMIVTHDDVDHSGGALSVLQALPVDWMMTSLPDMDPLLFSADAALRCRGGVKWEWDGVRFEMLHPNDDGDARRVKDNDRSCVLRVATAAGSVLLPADIESRSESELVLHQAPALAADVLVVPHHGSRTSSTAPFVAAVGARSAVFTVGYRNRLGHPHAEIVDRYVGSGARLYRTDMDGAVLIDLPSVGAVQLQRYRAVHRRYWYDAPAGDAARLDAELAASLE
jgi:competence protein ComEC